MLKLAGWSTTWALVTTSPELSKTMPEPRPLLVLISTIEGATSLASCWSVCWNCDRAPDPAGGLTAAVGAGGGAVAVAPDPDWDWLGVRVACCVSVGLARRMAGALQPAIKRPAATTIIRLRKRAPQLIRTDFAPWWLKEA